MATETARHVSGQVFDKEGVTLGCVDELNKVAIFRDRLFERTVLDHDKSDSSITLSPDTSECDTEAPQIFK